jgi:hypothetical protein
MINLKKLNEVEGKAMYHVEVSNRLAAFDDFDVDINNANNACIRLRDNIKFQNYYELKKHKHGLTKDTQNY